MSTFSFTHSSIGEITGKFIHNGQIAQFLGLQYASIEDRFAPPVLKDYDGKSPVDGTKFGPQVLSHMPGPGMEQKMLLQHELEYDKSQYYTSDLEGLNLNVTAPLGLDGQLNKEQKLPVFAFIHGGGFTVGSASFPQYDMARLVELSVENGMPIIAISLNYRLSAPGLLTSKELRDAGYKPNNALRDQQTALSWIQKHIGDFGGNPDEVTLMGQSAGAVSVNYHLHSKIPLFKRCIIAAGSYVPKTPPTLDQAEATYAKAIKALGLDSKPAEERIEALKSMNGEELCSKTLAAGIPNELVIDNEMVSFTPSFESVSNGSINMPGREWCQGVVLGDCQHDGNIQGLRLMSRKKGIAAAFCSSMESSLPQSVASKLLDSFNLNPGTPENEAFFHICEVINDIDFYAPTLALAEDLSRSMPVYVYRFNEPNPWPGQWKGHAIHVQDLVWLLQNFNEFLEEPQKKQAEHFAASVTAFVNGKECWQPWTNERRMAKVVGPEGKVEDAVDESPTNGRRSIVLELAKEVGMDKLNEALETFMKA